MRDYPVSEKSIMKKTNVLMLQKIRGDRYRVYRIYRDIPIPTASLLVADFMGMNSTYRMEMRDDVSHIDSVMLPS